MEGVTASETSEADAPADPAALPLVTWQPLAWPPNLTRFGDLQGSSKWSGGVLGADGETVFCVPSDDEAVLAFNTRTREMERFGGFPQRGKWAGAVLGPDKTTVYGIPSSASSVLAIDTTLPPGARNAETFGHLETSWCKWSGGVLGPDNRTIFGIPALSDAVLTIDTEKRYLGTFGELPGGLSGGRKWSGGLLCGDKIFGIPCDSTKVLVIDPSSLSVEFFGDFPPGDSKWSGGVVGPDNITIFAIPLNAESVLAINTRDRIATTFGHLPGQRKWRGGVLGPDNETIFGIPSSSDQVLAINTTDYTVRTFGFAGHDSWKWCGGVLGHDRSTIFGVPLNSPTVLAVEVGELVAAESALISNTTEEGGASDCAVRFFSSASAKRASVTRRESLMKQRASLPDLHNHNQGSAGPEDVKARRLSTVASYPNRLPNIDEGLRLEKKFRRFSQPNYLPPAAGAHHGLESVDRQAMQFGSPRLAGSDAWRSGGASKGLAAASRRHTTLGHSAGNLVANSILAKGMKSGGAHPSEHRHSIRGSAPMLSVPSFDNGMAFAENKRRLSQLP